MDKRYVYKNKKGISVIILFLILYIAAYTIIAMTNMGFFEGLSDKTSIPGMMTAVQLVLGVGMVMADAKVGSRVSLTAMSFSTFFAIVSCVVNRSLSALPGIMYMLSGILVVIIIIRAMKRLHKLSNTDALTGIANRRQAERYIDYLIGSKLPFDVYYIDLDHYKYINDSYGHDKGDEILKRVVRSWEDMKLPGLFSRYGGDEFLYIAPVSSDEERWARSKSIIASVGDCCLKYLADADTDTTASVGVASYPENTTDATEIISMADKAMYQAKKTGRNGWKKYGENTGNVMIREHDLENMIKDSLENDGFKMLYAPLCINGTKVRSFSAMIRLVGPDNELILPPEFIPVAQKSDLIVKIDEYEINRCIREMATIVRKYNVLLTLRVSAKQMITPGFAGAVDTKLRSYDFPADRLELELDEKALGDDTERVIRTIRALKVKGIKIALDGGVLRELGCDTHRNFATGRLVDAEGAKALLEKA